MIKDDLFTILNSDDYVQDQNVLFKLKPNRSFSWEYNVKHQTGPEGWRIGSKKVHNKDSDGIKIIVVGDSCTFGLGVPYDKTYGAILENKINEAKGQKVRVYNFGVPGFTSFQCQKIIEKLAPPIEPAAIICYVGANDGAQVMEYNDEEYYKLVNGKSLIYSLLKYSNVYKLLQAKRHKMKMTLLKEGVKQLPHDVDWFKLALPDVITELQENGINIDKRIFNKERVSASEFKQNVLAMKKLSQRYNATFIYIPNIWNIEGTLHYREDYLSVDYLDIKGEFEKYKIEDVLIDTVHPTAKGHCIIAEMVFDLLFGNNKFLTKQFSGR